MTRILVSYFFIFLFVVFTYATSMAHSATQMDMHQFFKNPPKAPISLNDYLAGQTEQYSEEHIQEAKMQAQEATVTHDAQTKTVARNAFIITASDVEKAVSAVLEQQGAAERVGAKMQGSSGVKPVFAYTQPLRVIPRGLRYDHSQQRWQASLLFVDKNEEVISAIPASGRYDELVEAPVLKRQIRKGEFIRDEDIEMRDFIIAHTRSDTVRSREDLIGKTPSRGISANRPIRSAEVIDMPIIKKNSMVQINYEVPGMIISATGQALSEGAKGQMIEVRNSESKKIIRAVVENATTVNITPRRPTNTTLAGVNHAAY